MTDTIEILGQTGRWRARDVHYWRGSWEQILKLLPTFEIQDFRAGDGEPANPYLRTVVRIPMTKAERPVPVGTVSNTYALAQHQDVAAKCLEGVRQVGVDIGTLECDLGLTELGEWMNLSIYFPPEFNHKPRENDSVRLRLECFNSVDGSNRLVIVMGWLRFVCSNGMIIGETMTEVRDVHNQSLNIEKIPNLIGKALKLADIDKKRLDSWRSKSVGITNIIPWVNGKVADTWGKKAACRVYHICDSGWDVDYEDPFAPGEPTEKPVKRSRFVPGSVMPVENLYDVSQALAWVATNRNNTEERLIWQKNVPELVTALGHLADRANQAN